MKLQKKFIRYQIMIRHTELVRQGEYEAARMILRFLRRKSIYLGLDDVSWKVQEELEKLGVRVRYSHNGYSAYAEL